MASDNRFRNYATIIYPESAPPDWKQVLSSFHIPAFASPLHDSDMEDFQLKKPHYHIMIMFEGKKTVEQVKEIFSAIGGAGEPEIVHSIRGYSRYLCHLDDPDKHRYAIDDVTSFSGADYPDAIDIPTDKYKVIREIKNYCKENSLYNYADLLDWCSENRFEWFRVLCDNGTYVIKEYMKSRSWTIRQMDKEDNK